MSIADKILLWKQALIETVNGELRNIAQIELMPAPTVLLLRSVFVRPLKRK